jgi:hypothetical protein
VTEERSCTRAQGFSLVEAIVSTALMLTVTAAVVALADPARGTFQVQLESVDMHQRLRIGAARLSQDLAMAGAGSYAGGRTGPLAYWFAPVRPYRSGELGADPPGAYRSDTLTLWYVPPTSAQTSISAELGPGQQTLRVNSESGCPQGQDLCGFSAGMTLLVYDGHGRFDTLELISTTTDAGQLRASNPTGMLQSRYEVGSKVTQVVQRTYARRTHPVDGFHQLVYYDGSARADVAVVDHLAGLEFEYFGDPQPPRLSRPMSDPGGPRTTYGPVPPAIDARPTAFPAGENCAFAVDAVSAAHVPRLSVLGTDSTRRALVKLTPESLSDGDTWCPDAGTPNRFDADLLRIRKIAVTLKVESAAQALRGPAGILFSRAGTARDSRLFLPDREVRLEITPPNMNFRP